MKIDKKINEFQPIEGNGKRMNFQIPMDKSRKSFQNSKVNIECDATSKNELTV